ncbi:hypothetical protein M0R45_006199 [Rubus argutus]|uniref:Uncharacterized protein n=1 Tax=Rubus argutus TaxID=59490 RepID=A0AAW1YPS5_RUBAR
MSLSKPKAQESSSYLNPITDRRSAEVPHRFSSSEADNLRGPGMLPRSMSFSGDRTSSGSNYRRNPPHQQLRRNFSSRHQVPAVRPDLYDKPRKNTKRRAFEGDYFEGVKVRRLILSEASDWELSQVDNTEFDKGWDRTLKFMEEFEALTAHLPSYGIDTPEVCSDSPCSICLQTGHSTCACPYNVYVPYGATVSKGYEIVCKACGRSGDHQHTYDGIPRRVVMKLCFLCHTIEDHWPNQCPMKKKSRKQGEFGSTSEQGHEHWQQ